MYGPRDKWVGLSLNRSGSFVERVEAIVQRKQGMPAKGNDNGYQILETEIEGNNEYEPVVSSILCTRSGWCRVG